MVSSIALVDKQFLLEEMLLMGYRVYGGCLYHKKVKYENMEKGHIGDKHKYGKEDHIHDYKPNSHNPTGLGKRQPTRKIKKGELEKDFNIND